MSDVRTDLLAERYGRPSTARRRTLLAVAAAVCLVALGWLAWVVWSQSNPQVQSSLRTYDVVDTHRVDAAVMVKARNEGVEASCLVRAYGADRTTVGELNFRVAGVRGTTIRRVSVRTERAASSVELIGCSAHGQTKPR